MNLMVDNLSGLPLVRGGQGRTDEEIMEQADFFARIMMSIMLGVAFVGTLGMVAGLIGGVVWVWRIALGT